LRGTAPFDQWPRYSPENADYVDKPLDLDDLLAAARGPHVLPAAGVEASLRPPVKR
jgi:hypothetical protein